MSERGMKVFVTDGDQRPALAIVRSLGRRGFSVLVGAERPASLAAASRYCSGQVTYPSPERDPAAFDRCLLEAVRKERIDAVVPVTDVTTHLVARSGAAIGRYCAVAAPPFEPFELAANKWTLLERAAHCGIRIPRTRFVDGLATLTTATPALEYPVVVKPVRSRIRTEAGWLSTSVHYARSESDLVRLYRSVDYLAQHPSLIQERIVGPGLGLFVLCDRGRLLVAFAHRRIREKPPSGGASVLSESVALCPELVEQARSLLASLDWHGVAMLEYKVDEETGRPFLMEMNGRFWGSLQLAVTAGVDFPYLSCQLALGLRPEIPPAYTVGVRNRWLLGDVDHLLMRLFHGTHGQNLPPGAASKARTLLEFFKPTSGRGARVTYDVASRDDPAPFLYELQQYTRDLAISAAHRARGLLARRRAAPDPQPMTPKADGHVGALR